MQHSVALRRVFTHTRMKEEKEPSKPISFRTAILVVILIHLFGLGFLVGFPTIPNAIAREQDANFVDPTKPEYVGVPDPSPSPTPTYSPSPSPVPTPTPIPESPNPYPQTNEPLKKFEVPPKLKPNPIKPIQSKYIAEYKVKRGDTFYSIVKRFKLNPNKLKELNNITNPNNLKEGQVLKFM